MNELRQQLTVLKVIQLDLDNHYKSRLETIVGIASNEKRTENDFQYIKRSESIKEMKEDLDSLIDKYRKFMFLD